MQRKPDALRFKRGVAVHYLLWGSNMAKPMRTVSFKLSEQLDDVLSELARRRKSSRSAVIREALEALANGKRRSVTAAVDELVAPLQGPPDLSTNPKHMAAYGR